MGALTNHYILIRMHHNKKNNIFKHLKKTKFNDFKC